MCKSRPGSLLVLLLAAVAIPGATLRAQSFGGAFQKKQITLVRKLPPTGHIDGSSFMVNVVGPGIPGDVLITLKSTIESDIVANDTRLRSVSPPEHADAVINCQVTTYTQGQQVISQPGLSFGKKPAPAQQMIHVTGLVTANFNAQDVRGSRSIAANTVTVKYDQQFPVPPPATANTAANNPTSLAGILSHIPKMPATTPQGSSSQGDQDKPPTPVELKNSLIQSLAMGIASHLVNTSEQVPVLLATGPGLDEANKLMDQKLWSRALEKLETMQPFGQPDQDAYRLYDLGVVNEALAYQAEDVTKASKDLQEASIDYGKAIDAKPAEKNFLPPQTRIDTALAHYKTLGDQAAAAAQSANAAAAKASAPPPADALTNADVIAMVGAKLDQANIIDTIKTSSAVNFDLSAKGQIDLAKGNVNGQIIAAMKMKARGQ
jgi:hypothetical protein